MGKLEEAIKDILGRGIDWYDYNKLSPEKKKAYYAESQRLIRSEVLINEANAFITDLVKEISYNSESYEKVVALRYSINGVKTLLERIGSIEDPNKEIIVENPDSAI